MKERLLNKKIPTILGLIILSAALIGGVFILLKQQFFAGKTEEYTPKNVRVGNVSDKEFTVSWTTEIESVGFVKYGTTSSLENTTSDDRDKRSGETGKYKTHFVTIKNLVPEKKYYFKLSSGKNKNSPLYDNNGKAYELTTGPSLGTPGEAQIVSGKVVNNDKNPSENSIIVLFSNNIAPQTTLTDKRGDWVVFINKARTNDLTSWALFDPETTILNIEILGENSQTASVITNTKNSSPLPEEIILGHAPYDFREQKQLQTPEIAVAEETIETPPESFPLQPIATESAQAKILSVTIDNPAVDGEKVNTAQPEIKGRGPIGKVLTIKLESPATHTETITVDEEGTWSFTPDEELEPGEHNLTVSYVNESGQQQSVSRTFVVLASGESDLPAFTATASATATPSASILPSPIATSSASPSATATETARVSMPSTDAGVPTTGFALPTFIVFLSGIMMIILGLISLITIDKH